MHSAIVRVMATIQVRDVSQATYETLRERAASLGQSLSEYLRGELDQLAARPTLDEMLERVAAWTPVGGEPVAEIIRRERDERDPP